MAAAKYYCRVNFYRADLTYICAFFQGFASLKFAIITLHTILY
jgi:hypothetical protein